jgi:hypothetical protein
LFSQLGVNIHFPQSFIAIELTSERAENPISDHALHAMSIFAPKATLGPIMLNDRNWGGCVEKLRARNLITQRRRN